MSRTAKVFIAGLLLLAIVMPMIIKGPGGKPIMSFNDWIPDKVDIQGTVNQVKLLSNTLENSAKKSLESLGSETNMPKSDPLQSPELSNGSRIATLGSNQMYKWKDKHGNWQFSNQLPVDAKAVQVEDLPKVKNVMDAPVNQRKNSSTIGLPEGISLENAGELLKKAGLTTEQQKASD